MTVEDLEKKLNNKQLDSIYLFYGEELFLLDNSVKKIKKQFGELINGINYIVIDENNVKELISDIETPAFGYEKKLIIIKNSGLIKKEGKRKNAELSELKTKVSNYIEENIEMINKYVCLVFIEEDVEKQKLYKTIDKNGIVCNFEIQKPVQIGKRLKGICNAYKVNISDQTLMYLIEQCGQNMQNLINEVRKLIEYAGENGTITNQEVDNLCIKQMQSVIFDLTDNLGNKNIAKALEVLNGLIFNKEPIQKIMITLYNHFKKLYFVQIAIKNNKDIAISLNLKPNQMFLVNKYKAQARYFKEYELKNLIEDMIELDTNYKLGIIDINIGLETILCKYCSK